MSLTRSIINLPLKPDLFGLTWRSFYDWRTRFDTIFALSTSINSSKGSPLGVIRVSGLETPRVIESLTRYTTSYCRASDSSHKKLEPRRATLAKIYDPQKNDLIDVGLLLWFPQPNSYTGEDTCELHVHGSRAILARLMGALGKLDGLRPADPGEFTRRAVENKKLSLIQAESLPELIAAQSDQQRKLALQGLVGSVQKKYKLWSDELVSILAHLEASIDFGEDELLGEQQVVGECISKLHRLAMELNEFILVGSRCRELIQSGARLAILGRPNAGKSTLMNMLCRQDKSIVSNLSGTTRDVIEHTIELDGHTLVLSDTAGLRQLSGIEATPSPELQQHNLIEREGIRRAFDAARKSNLILYLIDGVQLAGAQGFELTKRELADAFGELFQQTDSSNKNNEINNDSSNGAPLLDQQQQQIKSIHLVINKIDMCQWSDNGDSSRQQQQQQLKDELEIFIRNMPQLRGKLVEVSMMSCKTSENFDAVLRRIGLSLDRLLSSSGSSNNGGQNEKVVSWLSSRGAQSTAPDYVNERHLSLLRSTWRHLERARQLNMSTIDEMAQHVRESVDYLSRIVGTVGNERVLDVIFRDFCIGK